MGLLASKGIGRAGVEAWCAVAWLTDEAQLPKLASTDQQSERGGGCLIRLHPRGGKIAHPHLVPVSCIRGVWAVEDKVALLP